MIAVVLSLLTTVYGMDYAWKSSLRDGRSNVRPKMHVQKREAQKEVTLPKKPKGYFSSHPNYLKPVPHNPKTKLPASSKIKVQLSQPNNPSVLKKELRVVKNDGEKIADLIDQSNNAEDVMNQVKKKFPHRFSPKELKGIEEMVREAFESHNELMRNIRGLKECLALRSSQKNKEREAVIMSEVLTAPVEDLWKSQEERATPKNKELERIREESSSENSFSDYHLRKSSKNSKNSSEKGSERYNFQLTDIQFPKVNENDLNRIQEYERFQENSINNAGLFGQNDASHTTPPFHNLNASSIPTSDLKCSERMSEIMKPFNVPISNILPVKEESIREISVRKFSVSETAEKKDAIPVYRLDGCTEYAVSESDYKRLLESDQKKFNVYIASNNQKIDPKNLKEFFAPRMTKEEAEEKFTPCKQVPLYSEHNNEEVEKVEKAKKEEEKPNSGLLENLLSSNSNYLSSFSLMSLEIYEEEIRRKTKENLERKKQEYTAILLNEVNAKKLIRN